jgi:2-phosphosulfolactate phosphatase
MSPVAEHLRQAPAGVRAEWGMLGARVFAELGLTVVIIDVLRFTTTVDVALARGTRVVPCARDEDAAGLAERTGAALAGAHDGAPWSLSPAALAGAPVVARLVLPSANGSPLSAAAALGTGSVIAGCLRNATAIADWLVARGCAGPGRAVGLVPAGERWSDGSLRPALEDALGAGAVAAALSDRGAVLSAEAAALADLHGATRDVAAAVRDCASGRELVARDLARDVEIAAQSDASTTVPVLRDGAFAAG